MSLRNVVYTSIGLTGLALGLLQHEYLDVQRQEAIGDFLELQTELTPNTMREAEAYATDRTAFNSVYSALAIAAGVCFSASGTLGKPRKDLKTEHNN